MDRQNYIWGKLNKHLSEEEKEKIIGIITLTPEENKAYQDEKNNA